MNNAVYQTALSGLPAPRRGKVRDVYDLGNRILLVATDRISAFDFVFPTPVPDKGRILTKLTLFWLDLLKDIVPNHLTSSDPAELGLTSDECAMLQGRALIVQKAEVIPFECIVRGYITGSGWADYQKTGTIQGLPLPAGLRSADKLPKPVFTPSTKEDEGHDQNVSFDYMAQKLGADLAGRVRDAALALYTRAAEHALEKGIIIADTKFEFGISDGRLMLIDEVLTPDSSRFWPADAWQPGSTPPAYDKQYLRDWLEKECKWNKQPPVPVIPDAVLSATRDKYLEAYERITGQKFN